jgi:hypothetical protein
VGLILAKPGWWPESMTGSEAFFPNGNLVATEPVFASASVVQTEIMVLNITTGLSTRITTNAVLDVGARPGPIEATALNPAIAR